MKKKHLLLSLALAASFAVTAQNAGDMTRYLPSNWGNWQNLTYGVADSAEWTVDHKPLEIQISGSTIHAAWMERAKQNDGKYPLYYRRSTDGGKTWEAPQLIISSNNDWTTTSGGMNSHWMQVEGNNVRFAVSNYIEGSGGASHSVLTYISSADGGKTFTTVELAEEEKGSRYERPHIASDGSTVVVAANWGYRVHVFTSFDGGKTFSEEKTIEEQYDITDLQVSGRRWTILGYKSSGQAYDRWCRVYFSTSTDGGNTISTENLAYAASNGKTYSTSEYLHNPSYAYHPQMVQQGDVIDVMYEGSLSDGNEGDPDPGYDYNHTIHRRSTDGGKTWSEARYMPESTGSHGTIAAKGDNVYVFTTCKGKHAVYHSHDGGKTWEVQRQGVMWEVNDEWNCRYSFQLYIAPDDASGQHVFLTGSRAYLAESKDGFRTLCRNFVRGDQVWRWDGGSCIQNNALIVQLDNQGREHWFMWYRPLHQDNKYFWTVCHRIHEAEPNTGSTNMALDLTNLPNEYNQIEAAHQVIIPMTTSLHEIKKATTVECWVRPDTISTFQIACLTDNDASSLGSVYKGGWYLEVAADHDYHFTIGAGLTTELSVDGTGTQLSGGYTNRYRIYDSGYWHHVALTYDSNVEKDNLRLYVDGMLFRVATLRGDIKQGNNPIAIGSASGNTTSNALVDNFSVWDRALSQEELRQHMYQAPTGKEQGCRLMLTFDGSLQDQSPYHNDGIVIRDYALTPHDGIRPPHPEFIVSKDMAGEFAYMTDATKDGEFCWWIKPYVSYIYDGKSYYDNAYSTSTKPNERIDFTRYRGGVYSGNYPVTMVARGTGNCNAYASAEQIVHIGGLNRVLPEKAGNVPDVKLRIQGGYTLTYSKKPKVVLKQGSTEIEGTWDVEYGYDASKVVNINDLAPASFNLWGAPTGKYDVIVDTDTLYQAFTVEQYEEPDVWMQINGYRKALWNKYQRYSIDYGNRSNVAAYNTPIFIAIPDRKGTIDVEFDFDYTLYSDAFDEEQLKLAKQLGEYLMAYDEVTGDSIRIYSFFIPYIAPNSTNQQFFRIKGTRESGLDYNNVRIYYMMCEPWGPWTDDEATTRADDAYDDYVKQVNKGRSKAECAMTMLGMSFLEAGLTAVPVVGCAYNIVKTVTQKFWGKDKSWTNFGTNFVTSAFACGTDLFPPTLIVKGGLAMAKLIWDLVSNKAAYDACLRGDPHWKDYLLVNSYDPNEMIGPWGPDDDRHYIQPIHHMPYMITFENKSTASAPANEVFITDTLDLSKLDAETFNFSSFGWADNTYSVGGSHNKEFVRDVEYKVNGHDILVRVSGQFDPQTGIVNWAFVSLEKNGNELEDVMNGFLLPNNDDRVGEGYVTFTIDHKPNPTNGSTISNKATIIFDANDPIVTNTYVNTFDTDYPTSKITNVEEKKGQLMVTFQGSDKTSGIDHYTLYGFINDNNEAEVLASGITTNTVTITCEPGTKYGLCVIATDRVGWNEPKDLKVEQTITTGGSSSTTIDVAVADAGYATFYDSKANYTLPEGLKASVVSSVSGGKLSYQSVSGSIVPRGTAVLIEASSKKAATYTLTSTSEAASYTGDNYLYGSDNATTTSADGSNLYYKLAYGPSGTSLAQSFGWFWGAQNGSPFSIEGHRAWLAVPKAAGARAYFISGEEAGVEEIDNSQTENRKYLDLQGRSIEKPTQPGIYFVNGRKIVVR